MTAQEARELTLKGVETQKTNEYMCVMRAITDVCNLGLTMLDWKSTLLDVTKKLLEKEGYSLIYYAFDHYQIVWRQE